MSEIGTKKKISNLEVLFLGLAFFATYFGAGNLIYPPMLGKESGAQWIPGIIGFIISGVLFPLISLMIIGRMDDVEQWMYEHVGVKYYKAFLAMMLVIACQLAAVPRTGAVAIELGVQSIIPGLPYIPAVIAYFLVVIAFTGKEETAMDNIGKILTPALVIILFILIVRNLISPVDTPAELGVSSGQALSHSLLGGYGTGDLLVSFLMAAVFIGSVEAKGYKGEDRARVIIRASVIAILCMGFIYGGLLYLGACGGHHYDASIGNAGLLVGLITESGGVIARSALGIAVILACLTTAIGETTATAQFFRANLGEKFSYRTLTLFWAVVSCLVALVGLNILLKFINPLCTAFYAVSLSLLIIMVIRNYLPSDGAARGAVYVVTVFALIEFAASFMPGSALQLLISKVPLQPQGFGWVLPFIIGFIGGHVLIGNRVPETA